MSLLDRFHGRTRLGEWTSLALEDIRKPLPRFNLDFRMPHDDTCLPEITLLIVRGIHGSQISSYRLWWQGPTWLRLSTSEWPSQSVAPPSDTIEQNPRVTSNLTNSSEQWDLASRYSSWPKLIRITAYVMRYISRLRDVVGSRSKRVEVPSALSAEECRKAREFWLKRIQEESFPLEKEILIRQRPISVKSTLLSLHPFIGDDELIRVGERLSNAPLPTQTKHPILLASHSLVTLIVQHAYTKALHAGPQLTLATLRREFWILRPRNIVKTVIHRCVACTRERSATPTQIMGSLPSVRVTWPTRVFLHCGVDYAGPVPMAGRGRASRKAYIAVFVCMSTRAVHLEVVNGYSTPAFLGAYARFCARRGLPASIYSDNGTTFVGADRELTSAFRTAIRDPNFLNRIASEQVSWHFIPPAAPHFGGIWEAGVRSVKHHLRRVVGSHTMTWGNDDSSMQYLGVFELSASCAAPWHRRRFWSLHSGALSDRFSPHYDSWAFSAKCRRKSPITVASTPINRTILEIMAKRLYKYSTAKSKMAVNRENGHTCRTTCATPKLFVTSMQMGVGPCNTMSRGPWRICMSSNHQNSFIRI